MKMENRKNLFLVCLLVLVLAGLVIKPGSPAAQTPERNTISVLAYNIWGIISARYRPARVAEIPRAIIQLDPDIINLEEAFRPRDHEALRKGLEGLGYPIRTWHYQDCGYGTGLLLISRFEAGEIDYQGFKAEGDIYSYERMACRGLLRAVFQTPEGDLEFYSTHSIPRMKLIFTEDMEVIEGDPKELYRYLQMYELSRMFKERRDPETRSIIAAGDFNVSPEMREYKLLMRVSGLRNSFDEMHPGENPSTYCIKTNEFATIEGSRIDHILYQNYEGTQGLYLKPVESRIVMTDQHKTKKGEMHLSDHYGIFTVFEVADEGEIQRETPPGLSLPVEEKSFYLSGIKGAALEFPAKDREAWDALALRILKDYDKRFKPPSPAVKAAARILTAPADDSLVRVSMEQDETRAIERYIEKMKR
jgi:endonuclease/exonuclease/phosphatase family metal-dependent hydrolase